MDFAENITYELLNICYSYLVWRSAPPPQALPAVLESFGQVSSILGHHLSEIDIKDKSKDTDNHINKDTNKYTDRDIKFWQARLYTVARRREGLSKRKAIQGRGRNKVRRSCILVSFSLPMAVRP